MDSLSTGSKQLVEIAKALAKNSQLLIFDEPTSSLTNTESQVLFSLIRKLKEDGKALIYISHKMEEIFSLADRVTVLRDGKSVFSALKKETSESEIINHMVGRSLDQFFPSPPKRNLGASIVLKSKICRSTAKLVPSVSALSLAKFWGSRAC